MFRRMVNSHALRLVPGWNFSELLQARRSDSWTRSSASVTEPDKEIANARKFLISASRSSLKLAEGIASPLRRGGLLSNLESSEQFCESIRQRRLNQGGVMRRERASDRFQSLRVGNARVRRFDLVGACHMHRARETLGAPVGCDLRAIFAKFRPRQFFVSMAPRVWCSQEPPK